MSHLANPLATPEQLYRRSNFSTLPLDIQEVVFFTTQCLTQAAGLLLDLPQSVTAQANVILARYWLVDSPMDHEFSVSKCNHLHCCGADRLGCICCSSLPHRQDGTNSSIDARLFRRVCLSTFLFFALIQIERRFDDKRRPKDILPAGSGLFCIPTAAA